jgi:hypothetical protein
MGKVMRGGKGNEMGNMNERGKGNQTQRGNMDIVGRLGVGQHWVAYCIGIKQALSFRYILAVFQFIL